MADRLTLEKYNIDHNLSNDGPFTCDNCKRELPAFALVDGSDIPELAGKFVCGTCIIDLARDKASQATTFELTWNDVRSFRGLLLERCDWTQTYDMDPTVRSQWTPIRTQLRNLPESYSQPKLAYAALKKIEADYFK
jgi:hypothetical protein